MKTNIINKLAAMLTVSGLFANAPLTVTAASLTVSNSAVTVSGTHYETNGTAPPLSINNRGSFTGSNVILTGTGAGNGGYGVFLRSGGTLNLTDSAIDSDNLGVTSSDTTTAILNHVTINTRSYGVWMANSSTAQLGNVDIINDGGHGLRVTVTSTVTGSNVSIMTSGNNNYAILIDGTSSVTFSEGLRAVTTGSLASHASVRTLGSSYLNLGSGAYVEAQGAGPRTDVYGLGATALRASGSGSILEGVNATIVSALGDALQVDPGATVTLINSSFQGVNGIAVTEGQESIAINIIGGTISANNAIFVEPYSGNNLGSTTVIDIENTVINSGTLLNHVLPWESGTLTVNLTNANLANAGGIIVGGSNAPDTATIVNVSGGSGIVGGLTNSGSGALTVTLNNSAFIGKSTVSDSGIINLSLNNANWNLTGKSKITTLTGNGGSITIASVQGDDLTVSNGITGQTALHLTLSDGVKNQTEIRVIVDETNAMSNSAFTLGSEVSNGMYDYVLENNADGAWLVYTAPVDPPVNPPVNPPTPPVISSEGDAVINTAAAISAFWFTQLDNLHKRMGELRNSENGKVKSENFVENVWVRAYGQQINANTGITSVKGFAETQYGVDLGTDYLWKLDAANQLYTGIFAGYGGADRDFHTNYSGSTDSGYGGLYATWLNNSGWYADVVAKGQYFSNEFSGEDRAAYDSVGVGFSVEFGRQFEFKDGWFAEPSVQFSYLHLMNDNYTTRDGMGVTLSDADVLHIYGGARFGRNIKLTNSGWLQPYIKAGGLGQISSGNNLTVSGDHWRPNLDGARAVVGAGVVWQLNADSQLHLDYEASFGEKYDKPWGVNFGYRYQF